MIFTSSGTLINGFQMTSGLNGHVPNGHATGFISACLEKGMVGNNGGGRGEGNGEKGETVQVITTIFGSHCSSSVNDQITKRMLFSTN